MTRPGAHSYYLRERGLSENLENQDGWMVSFADMITLLFIFFSLLLSISVISRSKFELLTHHFNQNPTTDLTQLKEKLDQEISKGGLAAEVLTRLTEEGLQIQFSELILFPSGEARISANGESTLGKFIPVLKNVRYDFKLAVEGHTDDQPIKNQRFPSNWELSSSRATEVLRFLVGRGFDEKKMMAKAFASTRPFVEGFNELSRAKNRRVTLLVY